MKSFAFSSSARGKFRYVLRSLAYWSNSKIENRMLMMMMMMLTIIMMKNK